MDLPAPKDEQIVFLTHGKANERPTAHRLLREEVVLVRAFIASGSIPMAALEAGLSEDKAKSILDRPEVKQYAEERLLERAAAAGVTPGAVLYAVGELLQHPEKETSQAHLKAIDVASKVLKMVQPTTALQVNQFASPFAALSDEALDAEIAKRMSYREEQTSGKET